MHFSQLIPELLVENMDKTLAFYRDILGFETEIAFPEAHPVFARVVKDNVRLMLYHRHDFETELPKLQNMPMGGTVLLYFQVDDLHDFYELVKAKVTTVQDIHATDYGATEWTIEDVNGYLICFSQRVSK